MRTVTRVLRVWGVAAVLATAMNGRPTMAQAPKIDIGCDYKVFENRAADELACLSRMKSFVIRIGDLLKVRLDTGSDLVITITEDHSPVRLDGQNRVLYVSEWSTHSWGTLAIDLMTGSTIGMDDIPVMSSDRRLGISMGEIGPVTSEYAFRVFDFSTRPIRAVWEVTQLRDWSPGSPRWETNSRIVFSRIHSQVREFDERSYALGEFRDGKWDLQLIEPERVDCCR
jgi:hypothetical protein